MIQDKNPRTSYRQEGGAQQNPSTSVRLCEDPLNDPAVGTTAHTRKSEENPRIDREPSDHEEEMVFIACQMRHFPLSSSGALWWQELGLSVGFSYHCVRSHYIPGSTMINTCNWGPKKNYKQKTHKHFSDGPCGTIVPGTNPHPSQGQTGQNGDFTVEFNRKRPFCPRDRSQFFPGRGPVCPRDGSCLSRTLSLPKCLCLLVFFLPE